MAESLQQGKVDEVRKEGRGDAIDMLELLYIFMVR